MIPLNRHGPAILLRKMRRWMEPDLDPARVDRVFDDFDQQRGYAAWHAECRAALARPLPAPDARAADPVVRDGYAVDQVMPSGAARELLATATAEQHAERLKRDSAKLEGYSLDDAELLARLVGQAISPAVDAHCLSFFGSEYFVYWTTLARTAPVEGPASVSFMWHCDRGPRAHLKLLVYLNDHDEHGGGTSYLALPGSDAVARSGYVFARGKRRTDSLDELSRLANTPLQAYEHRPHAGDAVLFQPSRVLHRGVTPRLGPRYVLTLCLLPSPVPWQQALARSAQIDLRHDPIWHDDARLLAQRF
ncbi:hypothetical protein BH09PSE6_BH09PSE6_01130 [soil metagenome]